MENKYLRDIYDVHTELSEEATSIANEMARKRGIVPFGVLGLFKPKKRCIGLSVNEFITDMDLLDQLREVAQEALQTALRERPDLVVGLIVGSARNGHNYFDRHR